MTNIPVHDFSGLICPLPVLKLRRTLASLQGGDSLIMLATDQNALQDVKHFCQQHGHQLHRVVQEQHGDQTLWRFTISKNMQESA